MKKAIGNTMLCEQLPLAIYHRPVNFDNYYVYEGNREAVGALQCLLSPDTDNFIYLWGAPGAGVSHLLQSFQQELTQLRQTSSQYLSLGTSIELDPQPLFERLEQLDIVCIDDIHLIQHSPTWQIALFHLFNRFHDQQKKIVFGSNVTPRQLVIDLADLQSRLCSATVFQLQQMEDEHKAAALQLRARSYGLTLTDDVVRYILCHSARDTKQLFKLLKELNKESLAKQRKLTIPFVKRVLENNNG